MEAEPLNTARWTAVSKGGFHEAWFVAASDPRSGHGLWLRYGVEVRAEKPEGTVWASWFDRDGPGRTFALGRNVGPAAIGRGDPVRLGAAELNESSCMGDVEAGGHALRWRLAFGRSAPPEDAVPGWLSPVAKVRGSGYVLPRPATTVTGAVEVDGRMVELQHAPAMQGHLWPTWHFAAHDARLAIDGVARATPEQMVQVQYVDPDQSRRHCTHTALASMELRVRSRAFPGAPWRPEATLTARSGSSLEFCGHDSDSRVQRMLISAGSVAS